MGKSQNTQVVQLPIVGGLDAGVDPKVSELPVVLENAVYKRRQALSKRFGQNRSVVQAGSPTMMARYGTAVAHFGGGSFNVHIPGGSVPSAISLNAQTIITEVDSLDTFTSEPVMMDCAAAGDFLCTVVRTQESGNYNTYAYVVDAASKTLVSLASLDSSASGSSDDGNYARVVVVNGLFKIYYKETGVSSISRRDVDATGLIGSAVSGSAVQVDTGYRWDCCVVENSGGNPYVCVIHGNSSSLDLQVSFLENGEFSTINTAQILAAVNGDYKTALGCFALSDTEATVLWCEPSGVNVLTKAAAYNVSAANTVASGTIHTHASAAIGGFPGITIYGPYHLTGINRNLSGAGDLGTVYIGGIDSTNDYMAAQSIDSPELLLEIDCSNSSGYTGTLKQTWYRTALMGKPTALGASGWTFPIYRQSWRVTTAAASTITTQRNIIWMGTAGSTRADIIGKSLIGTAFPVYKALSSGIGGYYLVPKILKMSSDGYTDPAPSLWASVAIKVTEDATLSTHTYDGRTVRIGSSLGYEFDGANLVEQGFLYHPEFPLAEDKGSGTGPGSGTYSYTITYEWTDAKGGRHQSAPAAVIDTFTMGSSNEITVRCPTLVHSRKSDVRIVIWRTESGGTLFYRVGSVANSSSSYEVTYDDSLTDAFLVDNELLYTTGGVLEAIQPPPYLASAIWQDRHVVVDLESGHLRYSREGVSVDPPIHNDNLVLTVDPDGGRINALISNSDKLIAFKKNTILITEGDGFNDIGGGANFINMYVVSTSIGTDNHRSVVKTPAGIVFEASDGVIWLLDRSFQPKQIGDKVKYYTQTYGPITGAAVVNDEDHVVLTTASGPALVYNWFYDMWSNFSAHESVNCIGIDGEIYRLDSNSYIWSRDTANYDDNGAYIGMRMRTGWVSKADIGGWYRMKEFLIAGQNIAAHTLRIKIAYDYDPEWIDNLTYNNTALDDFGYALHYGDGTTDVSDDSYTIRVQGSRQKCSAFMLEISDEQDSGQTEGWDISAVSVLVQPHPVANVKHVGPGRQVTG